MTTESIYEWVTTEGRFPVPLYPYQVEAVNSLSNLNRLAYYFDVGTGKTLTSLATAQWKLHHSADVVLIIVPPVLLTNWERNVSRLGYDNSYVVYQGTPKKRQALNLDARYIIVGIQIFKNDISHLMSRLGHKRVFGIIDEAQMLKNSGSDNFKKVRDFFREQQICLLTGTPLSTPLDGYAMVKIVSPTIYKSQYQFESIHVESRDFFKKPTAWRNLECLQENLLNNAVRVLKEDVLKDLPELTYNPIYYQLDPGHLRLYNQLAEEQIVQMGGDEKLDLTNATALWNALKQIPCNAEHFSLGEIKSTALDLILAVLDELGTGKLVIFCHYKMTTRRLLEALAGFGVVGLFSETKDRQKSIDTFINDPDCRVIVLNLQAGGAGIDGLQDVCNDLLFVELPPNAAQFRQAVARVHRNGQRRGVNCRVALAEKTLQISNWEDVQDNDSLVNRVIRGPQDIRAAIFGGSARPAPTS